MPRFLLTLFIVLTVSIAPAAQARPSLRAPVSKYLSSNSVLARYYADFVRQSGSAYDTSDAAFRGFCQVLRTSDLLAEELMQSGIPTDQVYPILRDLERVAFIRDNDEQIHRAMLAVDYVLELIESTLTQSHRREFRREVLAEVPPLTYNG